MKVVHDNQEKLLTLLKKNIESPLTIRQLQEELQLSSPSLVHHHIQQLEKKGLLKRNPNNSKDYVVLDVAEKQIVYIAKYGQAQCGPNGSIFDGNPIDRIPIASRLLKFPVENAFIVDAKGNSMEPKIYSGDIIIAKKQNIAENGEIVVCINNSEVLVKKYTQEKNKIILHSINIENYHPFIASEDFRIEGVVKSILHYD